MRIKDDQRRSRRACLTAAPRAAQTQRVTGVLITQTIPRHTLWGAPPTENRVTQLTHLYLLGARITGGCRVSGKGYSVLAFSWWARTREPRPRSPRRSSWCTWRRCRWRNTRWHRPFCVSHKSLSPSNASQTGAGTGRTDSGTDRDDGQQRRARLTAHDDEEADGDDGYAAADGRAAVVSK